MVGSSSWEKFAGKAARIALAFVLATGLAPAAWPMGASGAFADEAQPGIIEQPATLTYLDILAHDAVSLLDLGDTPPDGVVAEYTGTCIIDPIPDPTSSDPDNPYLHNRFYVYDFQPEWIPGAPDKIDTGVCQDPDTATHRSPISCGASGGGPYRRTFHAYYEKCSIEEGWVQYYVMCNDPADGGDCTSHVSDEDEAYPGQRVLFRVKVPHEFNGSLKLEKTSSHPAITDNNSLYSLAGATYDVFRDFACTDKVATLTTDSVGKSQTVSLPEGSYYVKESAASPGYKLCQKVHAATVTAGGAATIACQEEPGCDPPTIVLGKYDADAGWHDAANLPQGSAALALAQYRINYYDGYYDTAEEAAAHTPTRTWVMQTDALGQINLAKGDLMFSFNGADYGYKVSGDSFYYKSNSITLPLGTVTYTEIKAPEGYLLPDPAPTYVGQIKNVGGNAKFTLVSGESYLVDGNAMAGFAETAAKGGIAVKKADSQTGQAQGDASLAGIAFDVYNATGSPIQVDGKTYQPGEAITPARMVTDEAGAASTASNMLPIGTYLISEASGNDSYKATSASQTVEVRENGHLASPDHDFTDDVIRGGVAMPKLDSETASPKPQGQGSLAATFAITNESENPVMVGGVTYLSGQVVYTGTAAKRADGTWWFETPADLLPFGTYKIHEAAAGGGYKTTDAYATFQIREDGQITEIGSDAALQNEVMRGDITFEKRSGATGKHLAGIPFKITSNTTGESHIIVTDYNGRASTSAAWAKHTRYTNANDAALNPDGTVDEGMLDAAAGTWFGDAASADDTKCALPFDTYTIEELGVAANEGLTLIADVVTIGEKEDGRIVDLGTIDDNAKEAPRVHTYAFDGASDDPYDNEVAADDAAVIRDVITYEHFEAGAAYTAVAELVFADTGEPVVVGGRAAKAERDFVAASEHGSVAVDIPADLSAVADGARIAVFETVKKDGAEYAAHKDKGDRLQTVTVRAPRIATSASDAVSGKSILTAYTSCEIVDTVTCQGLVEGQGYALKAALMDKATGEPVTDASGSPVMAEKRFTSRGGTETVLVFIPFDGSAAKEGDAYVVFEECVKVASGAVVARHEDLSDAAQTITLAVPTIKTTLTDSETGKKTAPLDDAMELTDRVECENLVPGSAYRLEGTLMDKSTGKPALDAEGNEIHGGCSFVANAPHMGVSVTFAFDGVKLGEGAQLVAYEKLLAADAVMAAHEDINDAAQTVAVAAPRISTAAQAGPDGLCIAPEGTVKDTVTYEGLVADGREYTVCGMLVARHTADDGSVWAQAYLDADGNEVWAEKTFRPTSTWGSVEVEFSFNALNLDPGDALVAFEWLQRAGETVAEHADWADEAQTVYALAPAIDTMARDGLDGDADVTADTKMEVIDAVAYKNVAPGTTYTVVGTLMDKATGKPVRDAMGDAVWAAKEFTPATQAGTVELAFAFDGKNLEAGSKLVAFERLYASGTEVAAHEDLEDAAQTVTVCTPTAKTLAKDAATGAKHVAADTASAVSDTVAYSGIVPDGRTYTAHGYLFDQATGLPATNAGATATKEELEEFTCALLKALGLERTGGATGDGIHANRVAYTLARAESPDFGAYAALAKEYADIMSQLAQGEASFKGVSSDGELEVLICWDSSGIGDESENLVAFEVLTDAEQIVAVHADLADAAQTVCLTPGAIKTTATDKTDGDHELVASTDTAIVDKVEYSGLVPGCAYTLKGVLMDKDAGKQVLVADKAVTCEKEFVPTAPEGCAEMEFKLDTTKLEGHELVVYETLYKDGGVVAAEQNMDAADQTVKVAAIPGHEGRYVEGEGGTFAKTGNTLARWWWAAAIALAATAATAAAGARLVRGGKPKKRTRR